MMSYRNVKRFSSVHGRITKVKYCVKRWGGNQCTEEETHLGSLIIQTSKQMAR